MTAHSDERDEPDTRHLFAIVELILAANLPCLFCVLGCEPKVTSTELEQTPEPMIPSLNELVACAPLTVALVDERTGSIGLVRPNRSVYQPRHRVPVQLRVLGGRRQLDCFLEAKERVPFA